MALTNDWLNAHPSLQQLSRNAVQPLRLSFLFFKGRKSITCHFHPRRRPAAAQQNHLRTKQQQQRHQSLTGPETNRDANIKALCACMHVANESHNRSHPMALRGRFVFLLDVGCWIRRRWVAWTPGEISQWITSADLFYFIMYGCCTTAARVVVKDNRERRVWPLRLLNNIVTSTSQSLSRLLEVHRSSCQKVMWRHEQTTGRQL